MRFLAIGSEPIVVLILIDYLRIIGNPYSTDLEHALYSPLHACIGHTINNTGGCFMSPNGYKVTMGPLLDEVMEAGWWGK